jgi:hypothetical protein
LYAAFPFRGLVQVTHGLVAIVQNPELGDYGEPVEDRPARPAVELCEYVTDEQSYKCENIQVQEEYQMRYIGE